MTYENAVLLGEKLQVANKILLDYGIDTQAIA